jgi:predicted NAD/FAD-dependent oxidoreductase
MKAVVFDTGEHSVGGRAATRTSKDPSLHAEWISPSLAKVKNLNLTFDHAAQCFTATDPAFQQQVQAWLAAGEHMLLLQNRSKACHCL